MFIIAKLYSRAKIVYTMLFISLLSIEIVIMWIAKKYNPYSLFGKRIL